MKVSLLAGPIVMANAALVTEVTLGPLAPRVIPVPAPVSERSLNVATPAATARVSVPPSTALCGLFATASVIAPTNDVAVFPNASTTRTTTAGDIVAPGGTSLG